MKTISVTGLGYVGLPLAIAFSDHTRVIGYDSKSELIADLAKGIDSKLIAGSKNLGRENLLFTNDPAQLSQADFHVIAVPTPINAAREPDLNMLFSATRTIGNHLKKGDIVVYESTVYPGLTEEECIPILEQQSGLVGGKDFHVGYSPERINPGDELHTLENTIKIVAAPEPAVLDAISKVYGMVVKAGLHKLNSIRVAEAAKVIENTQRDINIALMNELALIFEKMEIDTTDVLEAAGTKWNFLRFQPGLVGGHCIGVDPYYLTHKSRLLGYSPRVILSGRSINDSMGVYVARMIVKQLIKSGIVVKNSVITVLGFTFKENIADVRNTRVIDIVRELQSFDIRVQVHDPMADSKDVRNEYGLELLAREQLEKAGAIVLAVPHSGFAQEGWALIQSLLQDGTGVVFDVKSLLSRDAKPENINLLRL